MVNHKRLFRILSRGTADGAQTWRPQAGDGDAGADAGARVPNDRWSLDFVSDQLPDGRRFRILVIVDDCTRECLTPVADTSLSAAGASPASSTAVIACAASPGRSSAITAPS